MVRQEKTQIAAHQSTHHQHWSNNKLLMFSFFIGVFWLLWDLFLFLRFGNKCWWFLASAVGVYNMYMLFFKTFLCFILMSNKFCHHRLRFCPQQSFSFVLPLLAAYVATYFMQNLHRHRKKNKTMNISLILFLYLWNLWYALLEQISMCGNSLKWMETRKILISGEASI